MANAVVEAAVGAVRVDGSVTCRLSQHVQHPSPEMLKLSTDLTTKFTPVFHRRRL